MNLGKLLSPKENRFKFVEDDNFYEQFGSCIRGSIMSFIRGGIIGGISAYILSGGHPRYTVLGAGIGSAFDVAQDALRKISLLSMYHRNPKEYKKYMEEDYNRDVEIQPHKSEIACDKFLVEFRKDPESARNYVESKGKISKWLLENLMVGNNGIKYHVAKEVMEEIKE